MQAVVRGWLARRALVAARKRRDQEIEERKSRLQQMRAQAQKQSKPTGSEETVPVEGSVGLLTITPNTLHRKWASKVAQLTTAKSMEATSTSTSSVDRDASPQEQQQNVAPLMTALEQKKAELARIRAERQLLQLRKAQMSGVAGSSISEGMVAVEQVPAPAPAPPKTFSGISLVPAGQTITPATPRRMLLRFPTGRKRGVTWASPNSLCKADDTYPEHHSPTFAKSLEPQSVLKVVSVPMRKKHMYVLVKCACSAFAQTPRVHKVPTLESK